MPPFPPPPSWVSASPSGWVLESIKCGVVVGKFPLTGARFLLGRGDGVDVELSGDLVSRSHGALSFMGPPGGPDSGFPFFQDNASTHGTVLNKRMKGTAAGRLPPLHHVKLFSGDVLSFGVVPNADAKADKIVGEKERLYVLRNVESDKYDRQVSAGVFRARTVLKQGQDPQLLLDTAREEKKEKELQKAEQEGGGGISWGFQEDAVEEEDDHVSSSSSASSSSRAFSRNGGGDDDDDDDSAASERFGPPSYPPQGRSTFNQSSFGVASSQHESPFDHSSLPPSLHGLHSSYLKKLQKLRNLSVEAERIEAKADASDAGALTAGQEARLLKLREQIEAMEGERGALEENIRDGLARETGGDKERVKERKKSAVQEVGEGAHDDEDDFFDRTMSVSSGSNNAVSEKDLRKKWSDLRAEVQKLETVTVPSLAERMGRLSAKIAAAKKGGDDLDVYMLEQEFASLKAEKDKALNVVVPAKITESEEVVRLLKIVTNGKWTPETELSSVEIPRPATANELATPTPIIPAAATAAAGGETKDLMPPPPPSTSHNASSEGMLPPSLRSSSLPSSSVTPSATVVPPKRSIGVSLPNPASSDASDPPAKKLRPVVGPTLPPPLGATSSSPNNAHVGGPAVSRANSNVAEGGKVSRPAPEALETWVAPEGQDGSGITKLNAKFAGRY